MKFSMDLKIIFLTAILGTVWAKSANNIYIPLVKVQTDGGEVSESQYVTKEYIEEVFVNISNRLDCKCNSDGSNHATKTDIAELKRELIAIISAVIKEEKTYATDCEDIQNDGNRTTGIYTIYPFQKAKENISVRCDMDTSSGGWIVIQRRVSDTDFYRTWDEYENGFGNLSANFWLGNRYLHLITSQDKYELRVDLTNYAGETAYAHYRDFNIGDAESSYQLSVGGYSGTAGDSLLRYHNGMKFSTYDRDNDPDSRNCAVLYHGAWWYKRCHNSNLNGDYGSTESAKGLSWAAWKGNHAPMKITEMKIRRAG
ncbi:ficolin-1-like [Mercenaria mercenaria]|uniref:ficolin-1-like n=1 Tax=Mercenaria mercenaria TaxID=6596 RepID=UPI00234EFC90|nr:ficolin-1-like [Mercenaria mercenaria]